MSGLRYTLTPKILLQAARAHNRSKWPRFLVVSTLCGGLLGVAIELLVTGELDLLFGTEMAVFALAWSIILFGWTQLWRIPRKLRKAMSFLDADCFDFEVEWTETHFSVRTGDGHSSTKFLRLAGWRQAGPLLLIYRMPDVYNVIPETAFNDPTQREELIAHLSVAGVAAL